MQNNFSAGIVLTVYAKLKRVCLY